MAAGQRSESAIMQNSLSRSAVVRLRPFDRPAREVVTERDRSGMVGQTLVGSGARAVAAKRLLAALTSGDGSHVLATIPGSCPAVTLL